MNIDKIRVLDDLKVVRFSKDEISIGGTVYPRSTVANRASNGAKPVVYEIAGGYYWVADGDDWAKILNRMDMYVPEVGECFEWSTTGGVWHHGKCKEVEDYGCYPKVWFKNEEGKDVFVWSMHCRPDSHPTPAPTCFNSFGNSKGGYNLDAVAESILNLKDRIEKLENRDGLRTED